MAIAQGKRLISVLASANGDGTGTSDAIGDYSSTDLDLRVSPDDLDAFEIHRMIVSVEDVGSFDAGAYGNNITITNGIVVTAMQGATTLYTMTAFPILTNGDWASHCYDVKLSNFGQGNEIMALRWTFDKTGRPVVLDGSRAQFLNINLSDDFTGLVHHRFVVQGFYIDENT